MPRKNNKAKSNFTRYSFGAPHNKKRYSTEQEARRTAEEQMLLNPGLELHIYKDIDGGWYLTKKK